MPRPDPARGRRCCCRPPSAGLQRLVLVPGWPCSILTWNFFLSVGSQAQVHFEQPKPDIPIPQPHLSSGQARTKGQYLCLDFTLASTSASTLPSTSTTPHARHSTPSPELAHASACLVKESGCLCFLSLASSGGGTVDSKPPLTFPHPSDPASPPASQSAPPALPLPIHLRVSSQRQQSPAELRLCN